MIRAMIDKKSAARDTRSSTSDGGINMSKRVTGKNPTALTAEDVRTYIRTEMATIKEAEDKAAAHEAFRSKPIYQLTRSLLARAHAMVLRLEKFTDEQKAVVFRRLMGHEAHLLRHGEQLFSTLTFVSENHYSLILGGKTQTYANVSGIGETKVEIEQRYHIPLSLIADIFNEAGWTDLGEKPNQAYMDEARALAGRETQRRYWDRPFPPFGPGEFFRDIIEETVVSLIEKNSIILKPRGDGSFVLEIEGLAEARALAERNKEIAKLRQDFGYGFGVRYSRVVKTWLQSGDTTLKTEINSAIETSEQT
jgi:hypothetical protein